MSTWTPRHTRIAGWGALACAVWLIGCPWVRSVRITPQKLHGTWRSSGEGADLLLAFSPDGTARFQAVPASAWLRFFGGSLDVRGRWRLKGRELTIELSETPANLVWLGENWRGQTFVERIQRLTDTELQFADGETHQRSLLEAPPHAASREPGRRRRAGSSTMPARARRSSGTARATGQFRHGLSPARSAQRAEGTSSTDDGWRSGKAA